MVLSLMYIHATSVTMSAIGRPMTIPNVPRMIFFLFAFINGCIGGEVPVKPTPNAIEGEVLEETKDGLTRLFKGIGRDGQI